MPIHNDLRFIVCLLPFQIGLLNLAQDIQVNVGDETFALRKMDSRYLGMLDADFGGFGNIALCAQTIGLICRTMLDLEGEGGLRLFV